MSTTASTSSSSSTNQTEQSKPLNAASRMSHISSESNNHGVSFSEKLAFHPNGETSSPSSNVAIPLGKDTRRNLPETTTPSTRSNARTEDNIVKLSLRHLKRKLDFPPNSAQSFQSASTDGRGISRGGRDHSSIPKAMRTSKSVLYSRFFFVLVLAIVAATLGYVAYDLMEEAETKLATERFESISERALSTAELVLGEQRKASDSLALMMAALHPNVKDPSSEYGGWPYVYMTGFEEVASSLRIVTEGSLSFCPIVRPGGEEQDRFEEFAYNLFLNISEYPEGTGESDFGRGIFSYGSGETGNETWPDGRFHIQSDWTYHQSKEAVLTPFLQSYAGPHSVLMLNTHFEHSRAAAIDQVIQCSRERAMALDYDRECASITDLMWSATSADVDPGAAGLMMIPIYPRNENTTLTGLIIAKQIWHDLLKHGFEQDVNGVDIVLRTESKAHTYRVINGEAMWLGEGSIDQYLDPNPSIRLSNTGRHINPRFFSDASVKYYMDIYTNSDFYEDYRTNNPKIACMGAVLIMVGTCVLFFAYDYFVRKDFHDKRKLMDAKRQFVRFVSHEVRTPLNTICMGLTLLKHDFHNAFETLKKKEGANEKNSMESKKDSLCSAKITEWSSLSTEIFESAETAVNVLSDLLNYDKIQMGTLKLELTTFSPFQAIERTVREFKIAAQERKINLFVDFSPLVKHNKDTTNSSKNEDFTREELMEEAAIVIENSQQLPMSIQNMCVIADNVRLAQVFRNLLSNGLKFSTENSNLTVRVSKRSLPARKQRWKSVALQDKDEIEDKNVLQTATLFIDVIDEGVGMTPEQVTTVFQDGTQFDANKYQSGGGSGLGLSIAQGIVKEHGGKLVCSSAGLNMGTTFSLSLPLHKQDVTEGKVCDEKKDATDHIATHTINRAVTDNMPSPSSSSEVDSDFGLPKLNILVVDDALTNRKLCIRLLERNGHRCDGASDGQEAVTKVQDSLQNGRPYDCILLDYEMPVMNGPDACQKMRELGCSSYIAGVTGNLLSEDVAHFRKCGANWVFPKPFKMAALEEQLIEDGVTAFSPQEFELSNSVRVESSSDLVGLIQSEDDER